MTVQPTDVSRSLAENARHEDRTVLWVAGAEPGAHLAVAALAADQGHARTEVTRVDVLTLAARLDRGSPDVLVLAGTGALELCRALRASRDALALPILLLGAPVAEALAAGASDGLAAPWEAVELAARAEALARLRRRHEEALAEAREESRQMEGTRWTDLEDHECAKADLGALLAAAPAGIAVLDRQLRFVRINRSMARFNRAPVEAHLGRTVAEMLPDFAPVLEPILGRVLETGEPCLERELALVDASGSESIYLSSYFPVRVAGDIVGVAALVLDYTDRKRAVLALDLLARASAPLLMGSLDLRVRCAGLARLVVPELGDFCGVYLTDERDQVELAEAFAVDPGHVALAPDRVAHPASTSARVTQDVVRVVRTMRSTIYPELTDAHFVQMAADPQDLARLRRSGLHSWLCVPLTARDRTLGALAFGRSASPRRYDRADLALAEELARRAAVAIDNAQLLQLAEDERRRAEDASRLKDEFLANLSHELRTPLTAILGWARILRTRTLPDDKRARALEAIERNASAQARLVEDLLDISGIIAGKLTLETALVDLPLVIETALDAHRPAAEAKGLCLRSTIDPAVGRVSGDAHRLRQVVGCLLSNAVKFTPGGGSIEVRLARDGITACLAVADSGQGIAPDFLPHVFDRFRQADGGITRAHGGLGLGLSIARHLVELHGGTLGAQSAGEGQGATFTVKLPLPRLHVTPRAGTAAVAALPDLRAVRVLLAVADADTQALASSALESCGADVEGVTSAAGARAAMARRLPDVLLADLDLPGAEGVALARGVRETPGQSGVRMVALTPDARAEERTRALCAGFDLHVAKPIDPAELIAVVASLSGRV